MPITEWQWIDGRSKAILYTERAKRTRFIQRHKWMGSQILYHSISTHEP